jgi:hypothetical protein
MSSLSNRVIQGGELSYQVVPTRVGKKSAKAHSTRSVNDFIALLQAHGIQRLVDVRTIPRSRHNPQFNQDQLSVSLRTTVCNTSIWRPSAV